MTKRIENRIEVPGTPEEVWEAIATGHGTETWFVPAEIEPRVGGRVALDMGRGMKDAGTVTGYDPPHRFAYEESWENGLLATEFLVESLAGGTCLVRLVSTMHGDLSDTALDSLFEGWEIFLSILRLHMTHFAGQTCRTVHTGDTGPAPRERAFAELIAEHGLEDATPGEHVAGRDLAGVVEARDDRHLVMRLDDPTPGVALVYAYAYAERVNTGVHLYLYEGAAIPSAR
jgi:uncharacterized protein YndB with AHSA1/START domain